MENNTLTPEQEKLVTDNIRFVYHLFGKLHYSDFKNSHGDDFISEGMIGLVKAAKSFDATKGAKFATYAARCINNQFYMYLRHLRKKEGPCVSLSTEIGTSGDEPLTLADTEILADHSMEKELERNQKEQELALFISRRRPSDKQIFELLRQGNSQKEVSDVIGISQSYVSRRFRNMKDDFCALQTRRNNAI